MFPEHVHYRQRQVDSAQYRQILEEDLKRVDEKAMIVTGTKCGYSTLAFLNRPNIHPLLLRESATSNVFKYWIPQSLVSRSELKAIEDGFYLSWPCYGIQAEPGEISWGDRCIVEAAGLKVLKKISPSTCSVP